MHVRVVQPHRRRTTDPAWLTGTPGVRTDDDDSGARLSAFGHASFVLFPRSDGIIALSPGAEPKTIHVRTVLLGRGPIIEAAEYLRVVRPSIDRAALSRAMLECGCGSWRHHIFDHMRKRVAEAAVDSCQVVAWARRPAGRATTPAFRMRWDRTGTLTTKQWQFRAALGDTFDWRDEMEGGPTLESQAVVEHCTLKWAFAPYRISTDLLPRARVPVACKESRIGIGSAGRAMGKHADTSTAHTDALVAVRLAKAERVPMSDAPIEDEAGEPLLVYCTIYDVPRRRRKDTHPPMSSPDFWDAFSRRSIPFARLMQHFIVVVKALEAEGMLVRVPFGDGIVRDVDRATGSSWPSLVDEFSRKHYGVTVMSDPLAALPPLVDDENEEEEEEEEDMMQIVEE
jgi:hypothetical protein